MEELSKNIEIAESFFERAWNKVDEAEGHLKMTQETSEKFEGENSFKQMEIGSIPEDWGVAKYISKS